MADNRRKQERIPFRSGITVHIAGIDGEGECDGTLRDVSRSGARVTLHGPLSLAPQAELWLVFSSTGPVRRRCKVAWTKGQQIGLTFFQPAGAGARPRAIPPAA